MNNNVRIINKAGMMGSKMWVEALFLKKRREIMSTIWESGEDAC